MIIMSIFLSGDRNPRLGYDTQARAEKEAKGIVDAVHALPICPEVIIEVRDEYSNILYFAGKAFHGLMISNPEEDIKITVEAQLVQIKAQADLDRRAQSGGAGLVVPRPSGLN